MKTTISSVELGAITKEFQSLIGAKLNKIWLIGGNDKKELFIQLHLPGEGKKYLKITPEVTYLTDHKADTPEKPHGFCMFLRKYLGSARIRAIEQVNFERVIKIDLETAKGKFIFYAELFTPGNYILADENNVILSALETKKWKDREIKKGLEYICPKLKYNFLKLNLSELKELVKNTDKENIVKTLAIELGLGGMYAEELLLRTGIDKNKTKLDDKEISDLFNTIKDFRKFKLNPSIIGKDILPIELKSFSGKKDLAIKNFKTFNEALDSALTEHIVTKKSEKQEKEASIHISKEERILVSQTKHIKQLEKQADENQIVGEAIYHNYQLIDEILFEINKAKKNHSWKDIKERLKDHKLIKQINEKNQEVIIELKE
jgi:predicted ribosome quality control (RQC) complex YloA/Tae2 family protein